MSLAAWIGAAALMMLAAARPARGGPGDCRATELGTLGGAASRAAAISRDGVVVGSADDAEGASVASVFRDGRVVSLGTLGGVASVARGIDGRGRVVGSSEVAPEVTHAFVWDPAGGMRSLGSLGEGRDAAATAINRRGEIVGYSQTGASNTSPYHAFVVRRDRMHDLGDPGGGDSIARDISDWGGVVGSYSRPDGSSVAFVQWNGLQFDLGHLGGGDAEAHAINERGQIVGTSQTPHGRRHAFRWHFGMRDLGTLGGTRSVALGLNRAGDTVGTSETADGEMHAFLVKGDGPMIDLHVQAGPPEGVVLREAVGIDDSGRIAANGRLSGGADRAFLLTGCL